MPVTIHIDGRQLREVSSRLRAIDLRQVLPAIAAAGKAVTQDRLASGGPAPDGSAWKPLNPAYAASKPGSGGILSLHGHLRDSIVSSSTATTAEWGSNLEYAAIHQVGGTIRPKKGKFLSFLLGERRVFARKVEIPARPYLGFGEDEKRAVLDFIDDWFERSLVR